MRETNILQVAAGIRDVAEFLLILGFFLLFVISLYRAAFLSLFASALEAYFLTLFKLVISCLVLTLR